MTKTYLIHPSVGLKEIITLESRTAEGKLAELENLAQSIDLEVIGAEIINLPKIQPSTFLGKGTVDRIGGLIGSFKIDLVIINAALGPVQQRNLEKHWKVKVIDRTHLILEIFGARAHTREGALQVELAALTYQRSRLVRSWTHLERQRGGFGFVGGPGESQLELDRRMLETRIANIKKALEQVRKTRTLHRKARQKSHPVVALVGYTNAGKSTLFNRLSGASVLAENKLFATLDPTLRSIKLPSGKTAILSDTVGFISDLPTQLVTAFRATLEEVTAADIILHVQDVSHPEYLAQEKDVNQVLESLGIETYKNPKIIIVYNKIDCLTAEQSEYFTTRADKSKNYVAISATTGLNCTILLEKIAYLLAHSHRTIKIKLEAHQGALLAWLYENAQINSRLDKGNNIFLEVTLDESIENRFNKVRQKMKSL